MSGAQRLEATCFIVDASSKLFKKLEQLKQIFALKHFAQTSARDADKQQVILYNHPALKPLHLVNSFEYYNFDVFNHMKDQLSGDPANAKPSGSFVDAIQEAINSFENEDFKPNYVKRIVFLTDLSTDLSGDSKANSQARKVGSLIESSNIWLYFIGLEIKLRELYKFESEIPYLNSIVPKGDLSAEQKNNFQVLSQFHQNTIFVDKEHGLDVIFAHKPQPKNPFPWYVRMNIGNNVEIPVLVHRTTRKSEIIRVKPASETSNPIKTWFDINTHQEVNPEDVVRAYKFHGKMIHLTPDAFAKFKKIEVPKCLTVFAFANAEEVPLNLLLIDESIGCLKPDPRVPKSTADRRFDLFATALRLKKCVALAYRVYNNNNQRKFFGLFPCPDHEDNSHLLMGQFPFAHEFRENFFQGKVEEEYESKTFDLMTQFFDKLSCYDEENGINLYPLPPSLQIDSSRARKAQFLIKKYLEEGTGKTPKIGMNPTIKKRALETAKALLQVVREKSD